MPGYESPTTSMSQIRHAKPPRIANRRYSGLLNASGTNKEAFLTGSGAISRRSGPARRGIASAISPSKRSIATRAGTVAARARAGSTLLGSSGHVSDRPATARATPAHAEATCSSRSRMSCSGATRSSASSAAAAVTSWSTRVISAPSSGRCCCAHACRSVAILSRASISEVPATVSAVSDGGGGGYPCATRLPTERATSWTAWSRSTSARRRSNNGSPGDKRSWTPR